MAVHDYVIDNSTGANVRADINNALAAIVSNNSSSSEPSTKYAYMWWADTTNGILKIRNSANDGWVELLQLDGTLTLEDGSASTPALAFRDDLNTGIFSSAADTFDISTGGTGRISVTTGGMSINDNSDDFDVRIEGNGNDNLVRIDAGNDRVGIGLSAPTSLLHVKDASGSADAVLTIESESASDAILLLDTSNGTGATADVRFAVDGTTKGKISFLNSGSTAGDMVFSVNDDTEKMRLASDGDLGVGISSALTSKIHAVDASQRDTPHYIFEATASTGTSNDGDVFLIRTARGTGNTNPILNVYTSTSSPVFCATGDRKIGICTEAPEARLHIEDPDTTGAVIQLTNAGGTSLPNGTDCGRIDFETRDSSGVGVCSRIRSTLQDTSDAGHKLRFETGTASTITDRLMIFDGGTVIIGSTTDQGGRMIEVTAPTNNHAAMFKNDQDVYATVEIVNQSNNTGAEYITFRRAVGSVTNGTISKTSGAGVNYNTSSDYRLKENVVSLTGAITRLKTLLPRRFNWIADESKTVVDGFLAHEVTAVPEAITGTKDEVNTKGEPEYQQMDHSKLVPLLVATVQELITKVEILEAA